MDRQSASSASPIAPARRFKWRVSAPNPPKLSGDWMPLQGGRRGGGRGRGRAPRHEVGAGVREGWLHVLAAKADGQRGGRALRRSPPETLPTLTVPARASQTHAVPGVADLQHPRERRAQRRPPEGGEGSKEDALHLQEEGGHGDGCCSTGSGRWSPRHEAKAVDRQRCTMLVAAWPACCSFPGAVRPCPAPTCKSSRLMPW